LTDEKGKGSREGEKATMGCLNISNSLFGHVKLEFG